MKTINNKQNIDQITKIRIALRNSIGSLDTYKPIFEKDEKFKREYLPIMIRICEEFQAELDQLTGYAELQKQAHNIALHVPSKKNEKNKINLSFLLTILGYINQLIEKTRHDKNIFTTFVGLAPANSSVLLIDFDYYRDENLFKDREEVLKNIKKIIVQEENNIVQTLEYSKILLHKGKPEELTKEFLAKFDNNVTKAYNIAEIINEFVPSKESKEEYCEIIIPSKDFNICFLPENKDTTSKIKKLLKEDLKKDNDNEIQEDEIKIIQGELNVPSQWKDKKKHSFKIKVKKEKPITIYYEPSHEFDEKVLSLVKSNVKIRIEKSAKELWFIEWLENRFLNNLNF